MSTHQGNNLLQEEDFFLNRERMQKHKTGGKVEFPDSVPKCLNVKNKNKKIYGHFCNDL